MVKASEERVLVLALGRDATLTRDMLSRAGLDCDLCASVEDFCERAESGAGAAIVAEEVLSETTVPLLIGLLNKQPPWSDLPLIIIASGGERIGHLVGELGIVGNVTFIQRPIPLDTLISTVQASLRARRKQYELRDLLQQREYADRRKDVFLAMLAHELRNPLAPIRTACQILRMRNSADPLLQHAQAVIERQIENLARLIDDLLDVSRITHGKIELCKQVVSLNDMIANAVQAIAPNIEDCRHDLSVSLPTVPIYLEADPTRLEQIITNLLSNAAKYTEKGGKIWLTAERDGQHVVIRVRDTGIGIDPRMLEQVFELFAQADRPLDRSQGGLGIGLTVVHKLVGLHRGTVEARSEGIGKGSEFIVRLPMLPRGKPERPQQSSGDAVSPAGGSRILIVDDNVDSAEMLGELLKLTGHEVRVVYDGMAAIPAALEFRPAVALLDIGLPEISGYELARRLQAETELDGLVLVAISGYSQEEDRNLSREAGFVAHLAKPVDPQELLKLLPVVANHRASASRA